MKLHELEKLIACHKHNECEVIAEIGRDRFIELSSLVKSDIQKAGLTELQAKNFLSHLSDIFRLEHIRA